MTHQEVIDLMNENTELRSQLDKLIKLAKAVIEQDGSTSSINSLYDAIYLPVARSDEG